MIPPKTHFPADNAVVCALVSLCYLHYTSSKTWTAYWCWIDIHLGSDHCIWHSAESWKAEIYLQHQGNECDLQNWHKTSHLKLQFWRQIHVIKYYFSWLSFLINSKLIASKSLCSYFYNLGFRLCKGRKARLKPGKSCNYQQVASRLYYMQPKKK